VSNPYVSFVIIEYFSVDKVYECAESLKSSLTEITYEIIISSNSCYDVKTQASLIQKFPDIRWIFNEKNGGFAYGMNQGLKQAEGTFLAISNPDVVVIDGLMPMINFMKSRSNIGAIGPMFTDFEGNVQDSCRSYPSLQSLLTRFIRRFMGKGEIVYENNMDYSQIQTVDWIAGAFILVSRKAYEKTGGLDEGFFLYAEDVDWCTMIRMKGFEIVYYPKARMMFKGSRNARKNLKYTIVFLKSHIRYWLKFGFFGGYPLRKKIIFND
jgi:N-acetylglucosaminyl-diphospho-decaprenol L-rhamnosyltransferase